MYVHASVKSWRGEPEKRIEDSRPGNFLHTVVAELIADTTISAASLSSSMPSDPVEDKERVSQFELCSNVSLGLVEQLRSQDHVPRFVDVMDIAECCLEGELLQKTGSSLNG